MRLRQTVAVGLAIRLADAARVIDSACMQQAQARQLLTVVRGLEGGLQRGAGDLEPDAVSHSQHCHVQSQRREGHEVVGVLELRRGRPLGARARRSYREACARASVLASNVDASFQIAFAYANVVSVPSIMTATSCDARVVQPVAGVGTIQMVASAVTVAQPVVAASEQTVPRFQLPAARPASYTLEIPTPMA
jgi:hypothetical protein